MKKYPGWLGYIGDYDYTWKVKLGVFCGSRANWLEITISIHLNMVGNLLVSRNFSQLNSELSVYPGHGIFFEENRAPERGGGGVPTI